MSLTRRRLLAVGSVATVTAVAGCLAEDQAADGGTDDGSGTDDDDEDADDGSENGDEDSSEENEDEDSSEDDDADSTDWLREYDVLTYSVSQGETDAVPLYSTDDVDEEIDADQLSAEERDDLEAFVEETDFETSKLVLVAARASNLCEGIELEEVAADDGELSIRARVVDESNGEDEACAQATHVPTALVRVVFDGEIATSGSITVAGSDGRSQGFGYAEATEEAAADGDGD